MAHIPRPLSARFAVLVFAAALPCSCAQASSDSAATPGDGGDAAAGQAGSAGSAGDGGAAGAAGSSASGGTGGTEQTGGSAGSSTGGSGATGGTGGSGGSVATGGFGGTIDDAGADAGEPCGSVTCGDWKCVNTSAGLSMSEWGCCLQPDECGLKTTQTSTVCLPIALIESQLNVQCTPK